MGSDDKSDILPLKSSLDDALDAGFYENAPSIFLFCATARRKIGDCERDPTATGTPEPELEVEQTISSKWRIFFASERTLKYALDSEFESAGTVQHGANPTIKPPTAVVLFPPI